MHPPKRILCVDDHADTCEALTLILKREGYESDSAATAQEALDLAHTVGFALYVLDNLLPDSRGFELCRTIRELHPHTPIVIYSADVFPAQHRAAVAAGADAFVDKPHLDQLMTTIKKLA